MDNSQPIPCFNNEQLELLTQLRVRADDREYAYQSIMEEGYIIIGITAGLINLNAGDNSRYSHIIPGMLHTLGNRMPSLLEELCELRTEEQTDGWIEFWLFETIG